ncbi:MAG: hypothetical protein U0234_00790 [Sandaracinus sp.]
MKTPASVESYLGSIDAAHVAARARELASGTFVFDDAGFAAALTAIAQELTQGGGGTSLVGEHLGTNGAGDTSLDHYLRLAPQLSPEMATRRRALLVDWLFAVVPEATGSGSDDAFALLLAVAEKPDTALFERVLALVAAHPQVTDEAYLWLATRILSPTAPALDPTSLETATRVLAARPRKKLCAKALEKLRPAGAETSGGKARKRKAP